MSRIGEKPIQVPDGVKVNVAERSVSVEGPQGRLGLALARGITAELEDGALVLRRADDSREQRSLHGLMRSLAANAVEGVANGYQRHLEIEGVGFRASVQGDTLQMALGFSSDVVYALPEGVTAQVEGGTRITVAGPDKQKVGQAAARIRAFFPAEPYKGKGLRYRDERIRRKVGKTVA